MRRSALAVAALLVLACGDATAPATTQSGARPSAGASAIASSVAPVSPSPAPAANNVSFVNAPLTVAHGQNVTLQVRTTPNTSCSIEVDYKSGPSTAAGLVAKTSDGAGNVSWTWKVGANTTLGSWPITVTCGGASAATHITVT
jgi:hypothetical protein